MTKWMFSFIWRECSLLLSAQLKGELMWKNHTFFHPFQPLKSQFSLCSVPLFFILMSLITKSWNKRFCFIVLFAILPWFQLIVSNKSWTKQSKWPPIHFALKGTHLSNKLPGFISIRRQVRSEWCGLISWKWSTLMGQGWISFWLISQNGSFLAL